MRRREFLKVSSSGIGCAAIAATFENLLSRGIASPQDSQGLTSRGYGPLSPVEDETTGLPLLKLPRGFRYASFGWTKDPLASGRPTPGAHDGMAVIRAHGDSLTLCRNHEVTRGANFGDSAITYDPKAGGGCTNLTFDTRAGRFVQSVASLCGTVKNCAGGSTPWNSWLTCEETVLGPGDSKDGQPLPFEREHGYIFEVPADGPASPEPLTAMGRFVHEAVAVDPATGIVFETEDQSTAGFYRFIPHNPGRLAEGGKLEMMCAGGRSDLRKGIAVGEVFDTTWVPIEEPTRAHSPGTKDELGVYRQGKARGAATFARLEGCWYAAGKVYIVSTSGGQAECGQVFEYDTVEQTIRLIFESPSAKVLDSPDTITVSPSGALVLCEDGDFVPQKMQGLTVDGRLFPFAANNVVLDGAKNGFRDDYRGEEWAGATFSPDGRWLYVNIQTPGITFAITGPWANGPFGA